MSILAPQPRDPKKPLKLDDIYKLDERSELLEEIEKRPISKIYKKAMIENYSNGKKSAMYYMKGYDDATEDIVAVIRQDNPNLSKEER